MTKEMLEIIFFASVFILPMRYDDQTGDFWDHCEWLILHLCFQDLQQRRLQEAQDEYDQEQEILKEEFDTERWWDCSLRNYGIIVPLKYC